MKSTSGTQGPFQGWTPTGRQKFRSASDYWEAATSGLFCPLDGGKLARVGTSGTFVCDNEFRCWTQKRLFDEVLLAGQCPTCNAKVVSFGTRAGKKRLRCQSERRLWTIKEPHYGDSWAEDSGIPFDALMKIVILSKLGWSRSRIRAAVGSRKKRVLAFLNSKEIPLARFDIETEAGPQAAYYCLWDNLLREKKAGVLPIKLPIPEDRWEVKSAFNNFLAALSDLKDKRERKLITRAILRSLKGLLITVAEGRFGKRQLASYSDRVQEHLLGLAGRLSAASPRGRHLPKTRCYWCRASQKVNDPQAAEVELILHRRGVCAQLGDVLNGLQSISTLGELIQGSDQSEAADDLKALRGEATLEEILRRWPGASRSAVLDQGYEPRKPKDDWS